MDRNSFKKWLSGVCLIAAIGFGIAGFCAPPMGVIDSTVLVLIAQLLTASGTFLGLDVYYTKFLNLLKTK